jgi:hypothetical protein
MGLRGEDEVRKNILLTAAMATLFLFAGGPASAKAPTTWDGLVQVPSKRLSLVYLQPGADFRGYTKVLIEPTEVAFKKNWRREYNSGNRSLTSKVSEQDEANAITDGVKAASEIFTNAWRKGGYGISDVPGPDVLRVKTGVVNISVTAPDVQSAGRSHTFAEDAGQATLFVEVRDSQTGALLGRAVDQRVAGDNSSIGRRTGVGNRADFRDLVEQWAKITVAGMAELKAMSPTQP